MSRSTTSDSMRGRHRWWRIVLFGLLAVVLLAAGGFYVWATTTPEPGPVALASLESDELVEVTADNGYHFEPTSPARVGFILYPGGRVDPASYGASARLLAEAGYLVVVPKLRLNLAVLDPNAADDIISAYPSVGVWAIGGHSLGGVAAAKYARDHPETIEGLALWAAYPPDDIDLSDLELASTSIFGTRDGVTSLTEIEDSAARLPFDTEFVPIEGGNHAQFGDYGPQSGDNPPTISGATQRSLTVDATSQMLERARRRASGMATRDGSPRGASRQFRSGLSQLGGFASPQV